MKIIAYIAVRCDDVLQFTENGRGLSLPLILFLWTKKEKQIIKIKINTKSCQITTLKTYPKRSGLPMFGKCIKKYFYYFPDYLTYLL